MTDTEITALAREYAQPYGLQCNPDNVTDVIRFLLRRYALVEKSTIKEAWSMITGVYLDHDHITYDGARYLFNEVLFPTSERRRNHEEPTQANLSEHGGQHKV